MNPLDEAIGYALSHETPWPRDLRAHLESGFFEPPPDNEVLGPIRPRGGPNGMVLLRGEEVARWGDPRQVDFTFSVAKSYLSLLAGIAMADGLIGELDEPVRLTVRDGGFEGAHNGAITWRHLLQQTSEWEGSLFGKSDIVDRNRNLAVEGKGRKGDARPSAPTGQILGIQRRSGEPAGTGVIAAFPAPAAGGVRRTHHAADRRVVRLVVAWLSHVDGRDRWPDGGVEYWVAATGAAVSRSTRKIRRG